MVNRCVRCNNEKDSCCERVIKLVNKKHPLPFNELELVRVKAENIELKNIIAGLQYHLDDWEDCFGVVYGSPNPLPVDIITLMRKVNKEFKD